MPRRAHAPGKTGDQARRQPARHPSIEGAFHDHLLQALPPCMAHRAAVSVQRRRQRARHRQRRGRQLAQSTGRQQSAAGLSRCSRQHHRLHQAVQGCRRQRHSPARLGQPVRRLERWPRHPGQGQARRRARHAHHDRLPLQRQLGRPGQADQACGMGRPLRCPAQHRCVQPHPGHPQIPQGQRHHRQLGAGGQRDQQRHAVERGQDAQLRHPGPVHQQRIHRHQGGVSQRQGRLASGQWLRQRQLPLVLRQPALGRRQVGRDRHVALPARRQLAGLQQPPGHQHARHDCALRQRCGDFRGRHGLAAGGHHPRHAQQPAQPQQQHRRASSACSIGSPTPTRAGRATPWAQSTTTAN